jgi:glycosyltransferase involved in cell wall biosynthesis
VNEVRELVVLQVLEAVEGGTARHLVDIVRHTAGVHHVVAIPAERVGGLTDRDALAALRAAGADVHVVPMTRRPVSVANARAASAVRHLVRTRRPDVVHAHSSIAGVLCRTTLWRLGVPVVYTAHGVATGRVPRLVERALGRRADRWIAVSASEAALAASLRLARPDRITVIPNGIEREAPAPRSLRAHLNLAGDAPLIGYAGRLLPQKAPEVFLDAWAEIARADADVRAVVIGDGPQAGLVRAVAAGDPRLTWVPELPGLAAHLGDLTVLCLTSRFEGGPYVPLEAMRAGVPVVLTDVVGNADVVDPTSGVLVPADDPSAVAAAVLRLLRDPHERQRIAAAARARVEQHFDVTVSAAALAALYREVAR